MCVSSYPFQSVTNGKEKFSRLLFCRLKSDCRRTLGTESVRILESTAQDPCISDGYIFSLKEHRATTALLCICLFCFFPKTMSVCKKEETFVLFLGLCFFCDSHVKPMERNDLFIWF